METALKALNSLWSVLGEMSPYLLLGFAIAGALSVLVSARMVERHLGGSGFWPVFKASLFGVPLPLCSCGVIPVGASLRRQGASRGATVAFLISTPQTGVDSIMVTFSLMGLAFAIFRPLAAFISGLLGGSLVALATKDTHHAGTNDTPAASCHDGACATDNNGDDELPHGLMARLRSAAVYGFLTLPQDVGRSMLAGLIIAAVITAIVPRDFFAGTLSGGILAMMGMMLLAIPVYVCATASVPIAAALIATGVSPGVALVFLMTGPATNAATITTIWRTMGPRTAVLYLFSVAVTALASGLTLDYLIPVIGGAGVPEMGWMLPPAARTAMAVILLAVLIVGAIRSYLPSHRYASSPKDLLAGEGESAIELQITGMTCNHCRQAVERALKEVPHSQAVEVDLRSGLGEPRVEFSGACEARHVGKDFSRAGRGAERSRQDRAEDRAEHSPADGVARQRARPAAGFHYLAEGSAGQQAERGAYHYSQRHL